MKIITTLVQLFAFQKGFQHRFILPKIPCVVFQFRTVEWNEGWQLNEEKEIVCANSAAHSLMKILHYNQLLLHVLHDWKWPNNNFILLHGNSDLQCCHIEHAIFSQNLKKKFSWWVMHSAHKSHSVDVFLTHNLRLFFSCWSSDKKIFFFHSSMLQHKFDISPIAMWWWIFKWDEKQSMNASWSEIVAA